jgi:sensor histidine kinase YesM
MKKALTNRPLSVLFLAWLPLALLLPAAASQLTESAMEGVWLGVCSAFVGALLMSSSWALTGRFTLPESVGLWFYLAHLGAAVLFAVAWRALVLVLVGLSAGESSLVAFVSGRFGGPLMLWDILLKIVVYGLVTALSYAIRASDQARAERLRAERVEALATKAQLAALQSQLNPHFLFNTLHSLTVLIQRDPAMAQEAVDRLGELLRFALRHGGQEDVAFQDEYRFVENYLALERLRLEERLTVNVDFVPEVLSARVPPFCLQPLVENAIQHGIAPREDGGTLWITARMERDILRVEVRDDGDGLSRSPTGNGNGSGIASLRKRIESRNGGTGRLEVHSTPGRGFTVVAMIPTVVDRDEE